MEKENINQLLISDPTRAVQVLSTKTITLPPWETVLKKEFDSKLHPVMDRAIYRDIPHSDGSLEHVTRVTSDLIKLSVKRMSEMTFGIPVKRTCQPENDKQKEIIKYLENILEKCHIDSVNLERGNMLFSACEVVTLWYAVAHPNNIYGFQSPLKLRCKNYCPSRGDKLYPYFDEYEDMQAMSIEYTRKVMDKEETYFDTYTEEMHVKLHQGEGGWEVVEQERIPIGKIPCLYMYRPTPIWEKTANKVYEIEWSLSNNGNYLRKNSKPLFAIYADEEIPLDQELSENREFRTILQFPRGSSANYITWAQATESLKFHVDKMEEEFWKELQLPDWSYEKMKSTPMSGEARKQLFVDACMKVREESGRIVEFLDREISVLKSYLKLMLPNDYHSDIDALQITSKITPYTMTDWSDKISSLTTASGGKPIMSQRECIEELGYSNDTDRTLDEIAEQERQSATEMTM